MPRTPVTVAGFVAATLLGLFLIPAAGQAQSAEASGCRRSESSEDCFRRGLALAQEAVGDEAAAGHTQHVHALESKALSVLRSACAAGNGGACYFAGRMVAAPQELPLDQNVIGTTSGDSSLTASLTDAARLFRSGCNSSTRPNAAACNALGDSYMYGLGEKIQPDSAIKFYEKGCKLGGAEAACTRWAFLLEGHPELGPERRALAYQLIQKGCNAGSPTGCSNVAFVKDTALASVEESQRGTAAYEQQGQVIARMYRQECRNGIEIACNNVGALFANGRYGIPHGLSDAQRVDSARAYYKLACEGILLRVVGRDTTRSLGVGFACKNLGDLHLYENPPDTAAAIIEYRKGCLLFERQACAELALKEYMLHHDSAQVSLLRAVTACNEGLGAGCNYAGWLLREPAFVGRQDESLVYFRRACDLNYAWACQRLGELESTVGRRAKYHRRACDLREGYGCRGLAVILEKSFAQTNRAIVFYEKACDDGLVTGCWDAKRIHRALGDEASEGLDRAKACRLDKTYCKKKDGAA
jgi:uncharacterized protein